MSGCWTRASTRARRFCQPPDNSVGRASRLSKPARPRVSAKRAPRSVPESATTIEGSVDHGTHGGTGAESRVLLDVTEARALADGYFSAIGVDLARQNAEERGLAGTVRTDQADAVAFGDGEGNILEKRLGSEGLR